MVKRPIPLTLLIALAMHSSAQDPVTQPVRWSYGTEVIQTGMLNLNLRAQRSFGRWAFGVHVGYRPSLWSGGEIPSGGAGSSYFSMNHRNWMYQALTIGPLVRYHFGPNASSFLELDAFHRIWWFDRKQVLYDNVESLRFEGLRSERQNVTAVRFLWGATSTPRANHSKRRAVVMEGFAGVGVRVKHALLVTHEGVLNHYLTPVQVTEDREDRYRFVTPTLHLGVRLVLVPTKRTP